MWGRNSIKKKETREVSMIYGLLARMIETKENRE